MLDSQLSKEEQRAIEAQLQDKSKLEELAKQFEYNDSETLSKNLSRLSGQLIDYFRLSPTAANLLRSYLIEPNIPIEYTFKPLKGSQVLSLVDNWLGLSRDVTGNQQRVYSNNHRNILFKRVLFEQKETIDDYFITLSPKSMLKAINVYPILVEILNPYFLYEFNADNETYFDKVNSLNAFVEMVQNFINSEKRIVAGATQKDFDMLRRYEFERLIEYWETENSELTLLAQKRVSILDQATQTIQQQVSTSTTSVSMQTDKVEESLSEVINGALQSLNCVTTYSQDPDELEIIERICSQLRKEKINLLRHQSGHQVQSTFIDDSAVITEKTEKNVPIRSNNPSSSNKVPRLLPAGQGLSQRGKSPIISQRSRLPQSHRPEIGHALRINTVTESIYNHYCGNNTTFNSTHLEECLNDLGVIRGSCQQLIQQLVGQGLMRARHFISRAQFDRIMEYLMEADDDLTVEVIEEFLAVKKEEKRKKSRSKSRGTGRVRTESQWVGSRYSRNFAGRYLAPYY